MGTSRLRQHLGLWLLPLLLSGCKPTTPAPPKPPAATHSAVPLRVWVVVDQHFEQRFGPLDGSGRERLNQWLYLAERQSGQAFERKLALRLVGVGHWRLADGPTKLGEVFGHQVPR